LGDPFENQFNQNKRSLHLFILPKIDKKLLVLTVALGTADLNTASPRTNFPSKIFCCSRRKSASHRP